MTAFLALVIVGEEDTLCEDGIKFAERAQALGASVRFYVGKGIPHDFYMQHSLVPEAAMDAEKLTLEFLASEA